ncbi:MAG TPA: hypothetical protein VF658_20950 [Pyrinomonadaceae bacterium]|jgi:hypothetical protein
MRRKSVLALVLMLTAVFGLMPVAATTNDNVKTYYGKPQAFGGGAVTTYVTVDRSSVPVALGIEIPAKAFASLPANAQELIFEFPNEANTPFRFMDMHWNPQGHPPVGTYTVPHFDFHFYLQSLQERNSIDPGRCNGLDCADYERAVRAVPAQYVPQDYRDVKAVEPRMGNHLIDPASGEFNNQPFTRTFIYGAYDGRITFYEPMLSLHYLQSQPNEYLDLKLPAAYAQTGYYPTRYSVRYDTAKGVYRISLERFVYHTAQ